MKNNGYKVLWTTYARLALARMIKFNVEPMNVFKRSKAVLVDEPKYNSSITSEEV